MHRVVEEGRGVGEIRRISSMHLPTCGTSPKFTMRQTSQWLFTRRQLKTTTQSHTKQETAKADAMQAAGKQKSFFKSVDKNLRDGYDKFQPQRIRLDDFDNKLNQVKDKLSETRNRTTPSQTAQ